MTPQEKRRNRPRCPDCNQPMVWSPWGKRWMCLSEENGECRAPKPKRFTEAELRPDWLPEEDKTGKFRDYDLEAKEQSINEKSRKW